MLIYSELVEIRKKIVEENRELRLPGQMREDFLFRLEKAKKEKKLKRNLGKRGMEALRKQLEKGEEKKGREALRKQLEKGEEKKGREKSRIEQEPSRHIKVENAGNEKEQLQRIHAGWSKRAKRAREEFSKYIG